jgi:hypothetical protein
MTLLEAVQNAQFRDSGFTFRIDFSLNVVSSPSAAKEGEFFLVSFGRLLNPNGSKTDHFVLNVTEPEFQTIIRTRRFEAFTSRFNKRVHHRREFDLSVSPQEIVNEVEGFVACLLVTNE